jgi:hypothetical protein
MNNLSWIIYLAGVVGDLKNVLLFAAFTTGFCGLGCIIGYAVHQGEEDAPWLFRSRWLLFLLALPFLLGLIGSMIPTERTIYMIAASEFGETVVTDPRSRKLMDDLYRAIERGLADKGGQEL